MNAGRRPPPPPSVKLREKLLIASELMTHRVITVQADVTVQDAARLMLEQLGLESAAGSIQRAVRSVLAEGAVLTRDMGGTARTDEMSQAILEKL